MVTNVKGLTSTRSSSTASKSVNLYTDYTFHEGPAKGFRAGIGVQWRQARVIGNRGGERSSIRTIRRPSSLILMASTLISGSPGGLSCDGEPRNMRGPSATTIRSRSVSMCLCAGITRAFVTRAPACVPTRRTITVLTRTAYRTAMPCARRSRSVFGVQAGLLIDSRGLFREAWMAGMGFRPLPLPCLFFFAASRHQFLNRRRATGGVDGFFSSGKRFKNEKESGCR